MTAHRPLRAFAIVLLISLHPGLTASAQTPLKLWPHGAPGASATPAPETLRITPQGEHVLTHIQDPSITPYLPPAGKTTGAAVLVIPGGGHSELWVDHEGVNVALWLQDHGVAAFVLRYRLAREKGSTYTVEGTALGDTQRAIRVIRSRAVEWRIDPQRVGVMGFSAGGELAALAATRFDQGQPSSEDPVERFGSKPDFQSLLYPALPQDARLTAGTPPTFLACGSLDEPRIAERLPMLYLALSRLHVSTELHIYAGIGHGFGIRTSNPAPVSGWPGLFLDWLAGQGLLHR